MSSIFTPKLLEEDSNAFTGTGGVSAENRSEGFVPAFLDTDTGDVYLSRFADGKAAPLHILDGLPSHLIHARGAAGKAIAAHKSVIAGFLKGEKFFTREEAAAALKALG